MAGSMGGLELVSVTARNSRAVNCNRTPHAYSVHVVRGAKIHLNGQDFSKSHLHST